MADQAVVKERQAETARSKTAHGATEPISEAATLNVDVAERSAELFRMVLPVISKHGRGFAPISYALWYEYIRGENMQLRNVLDGVIADTGRITEDATVDLYQQHIVSEIEKSVSDGQSGLLELVNSVDNSVLETSQSVAGLDSRLESFADTFSAEAGTEDGRQQVSALKDDVLSVNAKMRGLKEALEGTRNNVQRLAEELAQTRHQARIDPLTGLLNRRGFDTSLADQLEKALHADEPDDGKLTMVLFDIDYFKGINDTHGHLTGDTVIRGVASLLDTAVMRKDFVSRYGGEEFALVMPTTDKAGGVVVAERIREAVSKAVFRRASSAANPVSVTVSAGVAQYIKGEAASELTQRADQALYRAKNSGRNRVSAHS